MRSLRSLFCAPLDRANSKPARTPVLRVAEVHVVVALKREAKAPRADVFTSARYRNGRPAIAVRTSTSELRVPAPARAGKEDAVRDVSTPTTNYVAVHTVHRRPCPVTLVVAEVVQLLIRRNAPSSAPFHMRSIMRGCKNVGTVL